MDRVIEASELGDVLNSLVDQMDEDPFTAALESCREPVAAGFIEIFASKEDATGATWQPHAPATVALYGPHPLLRLSDAMYESMIGQSEHHVESITDRELQWGTSVEYAFAQNFGWRHIPARQFAYFTEDAISGCMEIISDYVDREMLARITD